MKYGISMALQTLFRSDVKTIQVCHQTEVWTPWSILRMRASVLIAKCTDYLYKNPWFKGERTPARSWEVDMLQSNSECFRQKTGVFWYNSEILREIIVVYRSCDLWRFPTKVRKWTRLPGWQYSSSMGSDKLWTVLCLHSQTLSRKSKIFGDGLTENRTIVSAQARGAFIRTDFVLSKK